MFMVNIMNLIVYKTIRTLGRPIYKLLYPTKVIGVENIPKTGGIILAGNHTHNLNAATMVAIPKRVVHMLAKKELFSGKFASNFYRSMACIKVDRQEHNDNVNNEVENVLKNNEVVGIFPEGTTNKTNEILLPFKKGAVSFAKKNNVPIIPFAITGKYNKFKKGLKIEFGKPIKIIDDIDKENDRLRKIILDLIVKGKNNEEN